MSADICRKKFAIHEDLIDVFEGRALVLGVLVENLGPAIGGILVGTSLTEDKSDHVVMQVTSKEDSPPNWVMVLSGLVNSVPKPVLESD